MAHQRVAVTVFAEVDDAVDLRDAGNVVAHLIRTALPFGKEHKVEIRAGTWTIVIHAAEETGMASANGYLWTEPTSKAFRESPYC
jgi:hypothetical protein